MVDKETKLVCSSFSHGLRIIDVSTKVILHAAHRATKNVGIGGLKSLNSAFYFVMNSRGEEQVIRGIYSSEMQGDKMDFLNLQTILIDRDLFKSPTILSIVNDKMYAITNSQLEYYNEEDHSISDTVILESVRIIKLSI